MTLKYIGDIKMRVNDISGDSTIENVSFENGVVSVTLIDGESGETYKLSVQTDRFVSETQHQEGSVMGIHHSS